MPRGPFAQVACRVSPLSFGHTCQSKPLTDSFVPSTVRVSAGPASIRGRMNANDDQLPQPHQQPDRLSTVRFIENNRKTSQTANFPFKEEQSAKTASPSLQALVA